MKRKVAVIGAGIAGISAAIRLSAKGFEVDVFENNDGPGGKLSEVKLPGFRFDAGPSLFTLPELVDELFELAGESPRKYFNYIRLPIISKYYYEDGTIIQAYAEQAKFASEIASKTGEPKENVHQALANSAKLYAYLAPLFLTRSLHRLGTYGSKEAFRAYINLHKLDFFRSMYAANEAFFRDERVVQLFNRYATYNGSHPYLTPATMNIIPHLEFNKGAFFPKGGMFAITTSLFQLAKRLGVNFYFNQLVDKILVEDKKAVGIQIGQEAHPYDKVVCNMDIVNAYKKLMPGERQPKFLLSQQKSSSALIFYWGIQAKFPQLDLHNVFFSKNYEMEFDHIFNKQDIYEDPTVYLNITSKYKPDDAPDGCENWFTMINVCNNTGQDWDELIRKSRNFILSKLSRLLATDIAPLIVCEAVLDPRLIEAKTFSAQGALYGNSSNNKFAAFLKHANFSSRIGNLYFCGGSVHPGGGIPLCLLSAKIAVGMVK